MNDRKFILIGLMLLTILSIGITVSCAEKNVSGKDYRCVIEVDSKYGLIDKTGKIILKPIYDMIGQFHEGMASVCNYVYDEEGEPSETYCGAININGELKIPLIYDYSFNFYNGLAYVEKNQQYFLIDKGGKIVKKNLPYAFEKFNIYASNSKNGISMFTKGDIPNRLYGFRKVNGHEISPDKYLDASDFSDGLAYVMLSKNNSIVETGYIDKAGKLAFKNTYKYINGPYYYRYSFHDGMVASPECNYMNKQGKLIFGLKELGLKPASSVGEPDMCTDFNENLLKVLYSKNNFVGFLNKNGNLVIKTESKNVEDFSEGLVAVEKNGKWGFMNKKGKIVIQPVFDHPILSFDPPQSDPRNINQAVSTLSFKDGLAFACQGIICGYIDKTGKFIWTKKINKEEFNGNKRQ